MSRQWRLVAERDACWRRFLPEEAQRYGSLRCKDLYRLVVCNRNDASIFDNCPNNPVIGCFFRLAQWFFFYPRAFAAFATNNGRQSKDLAPLWRQRQGFVTMDRVVMVAMRVLFVVGLSSSVNAGWLLRRCLDMHLNSFRWWYALGFPYPLRVVLLYFLTRWCLSLLPHVGDAEGSVLLPGLPYLLVAWIQCYWFLCAVKSKLLVTLQRQAFPSESWLTLFIELVSNSAFTRWNAKSNAAHAS